MKKLIIIFLILLFSSCIRPSTERGNLIVKEVRGTTFVTGKDGFRNTTVKGYVITFRRGTEFYTETNYKVGDTLR